MTMKFSNSKAMILSLLTLTLTQSTAFAVWHGGPRDSYRQKRQTAEIQGPVEPSTENRSPERMPNSRENHALESGQTVSSSNDAARERTVYDEDPKSREIAQPPHHRGGLEDR